MVITISRVPSAAASSIVKVAVMVVDEVTTRLLTATPGIELRLMTLGEKCWPVIVTGTCSPCTAAFGVTGSASSFTGKTLLTAFNAFKRQPRKLGLPSSQAEPRVLPISLVVDAYIGSAVVVNISLRSPGVSSSFTSRASIMPATPVTIGAEAEVPPNPPIT